jgi:hypothetical protein
MAAANGDECRGYCWLPSRTLLEGLTHDTLYGVRAKVKNNASAKPGERGDGSLQAKTDQGNCLRATGRVVGDQNRADSCACSAGRESHTDRALRAGCEGRTTSVCLSEVPTRGDACNA